MPDDQNQKRAELAMGQLLEIMAVLRKPGAGCPWDLKQTFQTIAPYTIEEAYEVADAIRNQDFEGLKEELGDLLFQVVFHARMAEEARIFDFGDVAEGVNQKMRDQHPHVFGQGDAIETAEAQTARWEVMKQKKRSARRAAGLASGRQPSFLDGAGTAYPALVRAQRLQKRAAEAGFDWNEPAPVFAKVTEELEETQAAWCKNADRATLASEIGDLLFACVNLARHLGIDAETALRDGCEKFESRFRRVEILLREGGTPIEESGLPAMEAAWQKIKQSEE